MIEIKEGKEFEAQQETASEDISNILAHQRQRENYSDFLLSLTR